MLLWCESLNLASLAGVVLIVVGVLILNLFPGASTLRPARCGGTAQAVPRHKSAPWEGHKEGDQQSENVPV
jgi:hypothetical protein